MELIEASSVMDIITVVFVSKIIVNWDCHPSRMECQLLHKFGRTKASTEFKKDSQVVCMLLDTLYVYILVYR